MFIICATLILSILKEIERSSSKMNPTKVRINPIVPTFSSLVAKLFTSRNEGGRLVRDAKKVRIEHS